MARKKQIETPGESAPVVEEVAQQLNENQLKTAEEVRQPDPMPLNTTDLAIQTEQVIQDAKQESKKAHSETFPIGSSMGAFTLTPNGWEILGG